MMQRIPEMAIEPLRALVAPMIEPRGPSSGNRRIRRMTRSAVERCGIAAGFGEASIEAMTRR
jgi:hypothetical protein